METRLIMFISKLDQPWKCTKSRYRNTNIFNVNGLRRKGNEEKFVHKSCLNHDYDDDTFCLEGMKETLNPGANGKGEKIAKSMERLQWSTRRKYHDTLIQKWVCVSHSRYFLTFHDWIGRDGNSFFPFLNWESVDGYEDRTGMEGSNSQHSRGHILWSKSYTLHFAINGSWYTFSLPDRLSLQHSTSFPSFCVFTIFIVIFRFIWEPLKEVSEEKVIKKREKEEPLKDNDSLLEERRKEGERRKRNHFSVSVQSHVVNRSTASLITNFSWFLISFAGHHHHYSR